MAKLLRFLKPTCVQNNVQRERESNLQTDAKIRLRARIVRLGHAGWGISRSVQHVGESALLLTHGEFSVRARNWESALRTAYDLLGCPRAHPAARQALLRFTLETDPEQSLRHRYVVYLDTGEVAATGIMQLPSDPAFEWTLAGTLGRALLGYRRAAPAVHGSAQHNRCLPARRTRRGVVT